jgi:predicted secreted protein
MGWVSGIAVYILVWWISLFTVLPLGAKRAEDPLPGTVESAPDNPRLLFKFGITTVIATTLWLIIYVLVKSDVISFREMAKTLAGPDG